MLVLLCSLIERKQILSHLLILPHMNDEWWMLLLHLLQSDKSLFWGWGYGVPVITITSKQWAYEHITSAYLLMRRASILLFAYAVRSKATTSYKCSNNIFRKAKYFDSGANTCISLCILIEIKLEYFFFVDTTKFQFMVRFL